MTASKRLRVLAATTAAALLAGAGLVRALGPKASVASSHREAPLIATDPQVDNTDVYAFRSPDRPNSVTFVTAWLPFEEPAGGPNFYSFADQAAYDLRIDNDGDARPDVIYRWNFADHYRTRSTFLYNTGTVTALNDPDLNFFQTYDLQRITVREDGTRTQRTLVDKARVAPSNVGETSMPDYQGDLFQPAVTSLGNGAKSFAGQSDDPFFLDLRVFDLLYGAPTFSEVGDDTLAGFNVQVLALQVPRNQVALGEDVEENPVIGAWATSARPGTRVIEQSGNYRFSGDLRQVSRLGMPLVNEVVIPLEDKDRWNASKPKNDGQFLDYVQTPELPTLIEALYGIPAPDTPREDLIEVFLTGICEACPGPVDADLNSQLINQDVDPAEFAASEELRLNMAVPVCEPGTCSEYSRLGVIGGDLAGYPNGRRLSDDVIDISLQVVEGELVGNPNDLGDAVDQNPGGFRSTFPYVQLPASGSDPDPH